MVSATRKKKIMSNKKSAENAVTNATFSGPTGNNDSPSYNMTRKMGKTYLLIGVVSSSITC